MTKYNENIETGVSTDTGLKFHPGIPTWERNTISPNR